MKRKRIKRSNERGKLIKKVDALFRQVILKERLKRCEWCGRTFRLQISHILPKGAYPRLRYFKPNVLLLCFPCHPERWHKNPLEAARFIEETKGADYRDKLLAYDKILPKLTMFQLNLYKVGFEQELRGY